MPGQRPLDQGVGGQDPPVAGQIRRKDQVAEPDQPRIVLDDGGLGLLDTDRFGGARYGAVRGGGCRLQMLHGA
ncbi:hypothetical protein [Streptomyces pactum]|uniref:hypothetical protein n=1 Tax=Streptomyces pactum TaxID=68249 RepID=UPI001E30E7D2|nr:hypothetical protein [Streptomyces pactum]